MLSAEALRLAAIEVLSPTAANEQGAGFPTLAGRNVFDSRAAPLNAIDRAKDFTPVCSVYIREAGAAPRGDATDADDLEARCVLEIVAELAAVSRDTDGEFVDAIAVADPHARLRLAALAAQIRWLLLHAQAGQMFRNLFIRIDRVEEEGHAVPELGLRYQRIFLRFHAVVPQDRFSDAGGLPEPVKSFAAKLPAQSYAKAMLAELAGAFAGQTLPPLREITLSPPGDGPAPIATTGELPHAET